MEDAGANENQEPSSTWKGKVGEERAGEVEVLGSATVAFTRGNPQLEVQSGTLWLFEVHLVEEICARHTALQRSELGVLDDEENHLSFGPEPLSMPSSPTAQQAPSGFPLEPTVVAPPPDLPALSNRSPLLAILSVPAHMIPTDLLQFLRPIKPHIRSVCVLRHCISSTQYLVLIKMEDQDCADEAFMGLHGHQFSGLEHYTCHLAFARAVTLDHPNQSDLVIPDDVSLSLDTLPPSPPLSVRRCQSMVSGPIPIKNSNLEFDVQPLPIGESESKGDQPPPHPPLLSRPHSDKGLSFQSKSTIVLSPASASPAQYEFGSVSSKTNSLSNSLSGSLSVRMAAGCFDSPSSPSSLPQMDLAVCKKSRATSASEQAVPTCVVCLEIMDGSVPQVFTTVCNHSFHMDCLLRWENSPCPVCRFHPSRFEELSRCAECGGSAGLWCCLLCGFIGCGKQGANGHIRGHYVESLHTYAIELDTQHVWDFAGDGFVHRLVHSKSDGKLVEVPDPLGESQERSQVPELTDAEEEEMMHQKLEGLAYQYNTLVTQLLDDQRQWYEHQLMQVLEERDKAAACPGDSGHSLLDALRAERRSASDRCQAVKQRLEKAMEEGAFLQELNRTLVSNEDAWSKQLDQAQRDMEKASSEMPEIPELEAKVAKLMEELDAVNEAVDTDTVVGDTKQNSERLKISEDQTESLGICADKSSTRRQQKYSNSTEEKKDSQHIGDEMAQQNKMAHEKTTEHPFISDRQTDAQTKIKKRNKKKKGR